VGGSTNLRRIYWDDLVDEYSPVSKIVLVALIVAFVAWVVKRNLTTPRLECGDSENPHESVDSNQQPQRNATVHDFDEPIAIL